MNSTNEMIAPESSVGVGIPQVYRSPKKRKATVPQLPYTYW